MAVSRDECDDFGDESLDLSEGTDARRILSFLDSTPNRRIPRLRLPTRPGFPRSESIRFSSDSTRGD